MNPIIKAIVALRAALMLMPAGGARELVEDAIRDLEAALATTTEAGHGHAR